MIEYTFQILNRNKITNQKNIPIINNLENLAITIQETNTFFLNKIHKQVNTALTHRNWFVGYYIVEYEQSRKDRAAYGKQLYKAIAEKLATKGLKSIRERHLYFCKDHYKSYLSISTIGLSKNNPS